MCEQINHPVLWEKTVRAMYEAGVRLFIEVGPGQTLSKFVQKTLAGLDAKTAHAESPEEVVAAAAL